MNKGQIMSAAEDEIVRFVSGALGMKPEEVPIPLLHNAGNMDDVALEILRVMAAPWFARHVATHVGSGNSLHGCHVCSQVFTQVEGSFRFQIKAFINAKLRYYLAERELSG